MAIALEKASGKITVIPWKKVFHIHLFSHFKWYVLDRKKEIQVRPIATHANRIKNSLALLKTFYVTYIETSRTKTNPIL